MKVFLSNLNNFKIVNFILIIVLLSVVSCSSPQTETADATPDTTEDSDERPLLYDPQIEYMFVQTAQSATVTTVDNKLMLNLVGVNANTVYFTNRPARITGMALTSKFLKGFCFSDTIYQASSKARKDNHNPPNAAIIFNDATGKQNVAVVELMTPDYDSLAQTLNYPIVVLDNYEGETFATHVKNGVQKELPASMTDVSLFIDDCPDGYVYCWGGYSRTHEGHGCKECCGNAGSGKVGFCFDGWSVQCKPCRDYSDLCHCNNSSTDAYCRSGGCDTSGPDCF